MIRINQQLFIQEEEIQESFIRASGPGGQNVNKVATAVQLRFDISQNRSIPDHIKNRLIKIAGKAVNRDSILTITARSNRSQERNRKEARERLISLIRRATLMPKAHKKTRIPFGSRLQRMENKKKRGEVKSMRRRITLSKD